MVLTLCMAPEDEHDIKLINSFEWFCLLTHAKNATKKWLFENSPSTWSLHLPLLSLLFLCMPAVSALGLVRLLPVGLAVLVDERYLRLWVHLGRWGHGLGWGWRRRWVVLLVVLVMALGICRAVWSRQGLHNLAVKDAQCDTGHGVLEIVLCGQAVVEAGVWLAKRFQQDAVSRLQDIFITSELWNDQV